MSEQAEFEFQTLEAYQHARPLIDGGARLLLEGGPIRVVIERFKERRSNSANALYWAWMEAMAKHFSKGGMKFDKSDMHDLMRHTFLGYEKRVIGKTALADVLKSTADLDASAFCFYMSQVDAWAAQYKCLLPRPEDNDYSEWQRAVA